PEFGRDAAFTADGRRLLTAGADGTVKAWAVRDDPILLGPRGGERLPRLASRDGTCLVRTEKDRLIVHDSDNKELLTFREHARPVEHLAISLDNKQIASIARLADDREAKSEVKVWDAATGKVSVTFIIPRRPLAGSGWYSEFSFSPDGAYLVYRSLWGPTSAPRDSRVPGTWLTVFDAATGAQRWPVEGPSALAVAPDSKSLPVAIWPDGT